MMIGLSAGLAGYLIERLVESVPGELGLEILLELECRIGLLSNVIELTSNPVISTYIAGASNG